MSPPSLGAQALGIGWEGSGHEACRLRHVGHAEIHEYVCEAAEANQPPQRS